jgi:hypothetical protein
MWGTEFFARFDQELEMIDMVKDKSEVGDVDLILLDGTIVQVRRMFDFVNKIAGTRYDEILVQSNITNGDVIRELKTHLNEGGQIIPLDKDFDYDLVWEPV